MRLRQSFNWELQPKQNKPQISLCAFPAWSKYSCCPRRNENIAMKDGNTAKATVQNGKHHILQLLTPQVSGTVMGTSGLQRA